MSTKTETVTIKVTPEEKAKIRKVAAEKDITVSKMLHKIIMEIIKEEK